MNLAKFHEIIEVVGMRGKKQEVLLNPHHVVGCRPSSNGGSLIVLSTGREIEVTEGPEIAKGIILNALKD